jgi:hypothetical protein
MPTVDDPSFIQQALTQSTTASEIADIAEAKLDELDKKEDIKEEEHAEEDITKDDEKADDSAGSADDEGYYADEGLEEVEPKDLETPKGQTDMGQWVLENLPDIPVSIVINGQNKIVNVKRAEDLPLGFEFASAGESAKFNQAIADQTNRAYRLIESYQQQQQQVEAAKFSKQEDKDIQSDIAYLQRNGSIPKFKYAVNDPKFNDDPAVKQMQEVLNFYNKENQERWEQSQRTGRLFNRISYRDAFRLFEKENVKETPIQKAEDKSRKEASKVIANAGNGSSSSSKPKLRRNASLDEIMYAYGVE